MLFYYLSPLGFLTLLGVGYAQRGGLNEAVMLLRHNIPMTPLINDIILEGIITPWADHAYKTHVIRTRLGSAWELSTTDYGFERVAHMPVDIIHRRKKLAIKLKNSDSVNSKERRAIHADLREYKRLHPEETVIFGFINGRSRERVKDGILYLYGDRLLQRIFEGHANHVIRRLRQAVRSHF